MADKKIYDFLCNLGLSKNEANVYIGFLKIKNATVKEIADCLNINRISTHDAIQTLIEKGLLIEHKIASRKRKITLNSPEQLNDLILNQEKKLTDIRATYPEILETMQHFRSTNDNTKNFAVKFYEGKNAVLQVYKDILKYDEVYSFADLDKYYNVFPNTMEMWTKALKNNKKRQMWDLLVDSPRSREIAQIKYDRYFTKILPDANLFEGIDFADYLIYGNHVAIIRLDPENPVATIIESEEVAASLRALHKTMWSIIPE